VLASIQDTQRVFFVGWSQANTIGIYGRAPLGSIVLPAN
jgi:hypothetical protein